MSFKKFLKMSGSKNGQASLEYFILLAVIGVLTLIIGSSFLTQTRESGQGLFSRAVGRILNP